jgi:hypothetical protein
VPQKGMGVQVPPRTQSHVSDLRLFGSQLVCNDDSAGHADMRVQVALSDTNPLRMLRGGGLADPGGAPACTASQGEPSGGV